MTPQQQRIEKREQLSQRRADLARKIAVGEDSLLASEDDYTRVALARKLSSMRNELRRIDFELKQNIGETLQEFTQRMNCDFVKVEGTNPHFKYADGRETQLGRGCIVFRNGAWSDGTHHEEPNPDMLFNLPRQIEYLSRALEIEERKLSQCRNYIAQQADFHRRGFGPLPEERAYEDAKTFQQKITQLREELTTAQMKLRSLSGPSIAEVVNQQAWERANAANDALARANAI